MTRKQKIWKSLKRHTWGLRTRSQYRDRGNGEVYKERLSQSQPNLREDMDSPNHHASPQRNSKGNLTPMAKLKSIIRTRSGSSGSSRKDSHPKEILPPHHRVEFLGEQVIAVSSGDYPDPSPSTSRHLRPHPDPSNPPSTANWPQANVVGSHPCTVVTLEPNLKLKFKRQTTVDSTTSSVFMDDYKQEIAVASNIPEVSDKPFVTFLLQVKLKDGKDLVIRDASGTSDPYVKFKYQGKLVYKSNTIFKNLNPTWDEDFSLLIEDPTVPLEIEVFDYDRFAMDDFMGAAVIDLSHFRFWQSSDLKILLGEEGSEQYMGYINIQITIAPQTQEEKDEFLKRTTRGGSEASSKKGATKGSQVWTSVVNVTLVEGKNLLPTEFGSTAPLPDPYVKFKLGSEKYKTKMVPKTLEPKWLERFDLHIFDEQQQTLELTVLDKRKDVFMGRATIDLSKLKKEVPHQKWFHLEDEAGSVYLQITISGTHGSDTISDLGTYENTPADKDRLARKYSLVNSMTEMRDIGLLTVKVFKAQGLAAADIGGKSDPFCVLELVNARLQTHTEYKTLNPEWNKIFTFTVKDINSLLEITIYDEDPNKKVEFLGKVAIPILKIRNGEKRWYALKDRKLKRRAKGQMLLEMEVTYNTVRASVRTFNPKEIKFIPQVTKFKRQIFLRAVGRIKEFSQSAAEFGTFIKSCWAWESPFRSVSTFIEYFESDEEDDATEDKKGNAKIEERKSIKERLSALQDTLAQVQDAMDMVASMFERVKNTFNFTVPFLSWLAIFVLTVATILLFLVPVRWLILLWECLPTPKFVFSESSDPTPSPSDDQTPKGPPLPNTPLLNWRHLAALPNYSSLPLASRLYDPPPTLC